MTAPLVASALPLPLLRRGKVREVYEVDAQTLLLVASDRVSAFDVVMREPVAHKGAVLTQLSAFWFERLASVMPNHLITADPDEITRRVPAVARARAMLTGRAMLARRTTPVPFECVVRGYITGSAWAEYERSGTLAGERLAPGLTESARLEPAIFSPATKAETGHDENVTFAHVAQALGRPLGRAAPPGEPRTVRGGARLRRSAGHHHRRYQVRVRHHCGWDAARDRRDPHARFVPLLAGRPLPAGTEPAQFRQAAVAGLSGGRQAPGTGTATRRRRRSPPRSSRPRARAISTPIA